MFIVAGSVFFGIQFGVWAGFAAFFLCGAIILDDGQKGK